MSCTNCSVFWIEHYEVRTNLVLGHLQVVLEKIATTQEIPVLISYEVLVALLTFSGIFEDRLFKTGTLWQDFCLLDKDAVEWMRIREDRVNDYEGIGLLGRSLLRWNIGATWWYIVGWEWQSISVLYEIMTDMLAPTMLAAKVCFEARTTVS